MRRKFLLLLGLACLSLAQSVEPPLNETDPDYEALLEGDRSSFHTVKVKLHPEGTPAFVPKEQPVQSGNITINEADDSDVYPVLPARDPIDVVPDNQTEYTVDSVSARNLRERAPCNPELYCCPDPRFLFEDTRYPWTLIGRISHAATRANGTAGQAGCTGSLVGPRHVVTAAHCINWNREANGLLPWIKFEAGLFPGNKNVRTFFATHVFSLNPCPDPGSDCVAKDWVVLVLDVGPDNDTFMGYFGARTYNTDWDGTPYWRHVGYPSELDSLSSRPFSAPKFPIGGAWRGGFWLTGPGTVESVETCISPGDSGGPVFAWWDGGPYIIGVISSGGCLGNYWLNPFWNRCGVWAAGGSEMVGLIRGARQTYP